MYEGESRCWRQTAAADDIDPVQHQQA